MFSLSFSSPFIISFFIILSITLLFGRHDIYLRQFSFITPPYAISIRHTPPMKMPPPFTLHYASFIYAVYFIDILMPPRRFLFQIIFAISRDILRHIITLLLLDDAAAMPLRLLSRLLMIISLLFIRCYYAYITPCRRYYYALMMILRRH